MGNLRDPRLASNVVAAWSLLLFATALLLAPFGQTVAAQQMIPAGFRSFDLRHAQAESVASELRKSLEAPVDILVDGQQNRVLVRGDEQTNRVAEQLIRSLDQPAVGPANAATGTPLVLAFSIEPEKLERVANDLRGVFSLRSGVRITPDARTSQIIVLAPPALERDVVARMESLGYLPTGGAPRSANTAPQNEPQTVSAHQLRNITWREFEDQLRTIGGSRASWLASGDGQLATVSMPTASGTNSVLKIDRRRNFVSMEGPRSVVESWEKAIDLIDAPSSRRDDKTVVAPLKQVDQATVRRTVALLKSLGGGDDANLTRALLRIGGKPTTDGWGGKLVSALFQPDPAGPADAGGGNGDVPAGGAAAGGAPPAGGAPQGGDDSGLIGSVQIEFLEGLDIIIIKGRKEDVARVTRLIEQLQQRGVDTQPDVQVYQLRQISSASAAEMIRTIYDQVYAPRQGPVSITALVKPNALLLIGRPENNKTVITLLRQLDRPVPPSTQLEVFHLRHISALDAAQRLNALYRSTPEAQGPIQAGERTALGPRIRVVPDYRSNTLIVQASPGDMAEVGRFLQAIDVEDTESAQEVRIFKLANALAEDLAPVLQDAINGQLEGAGRSLTGQGLGAAGQGATVARVRSSMLKFMTVDSAGGRLLQSGILFDVRIVADTNSNALVVTGPPNSMDLIGALIKELDQLPNAEAQIKVFTVINGDATNLTTMLQQLFGQQASTGQGNAQAAFLQAVGQTAGGGTGESSLIPLRFAVDQRTNSIIASGSKSDLNVVEAILVRLDEGGIESRKNSVYRLRNAPATDVATAITNLLQQQTQIQQQALTNVLSPFEQFEREVIVVPEPVSNSLIISATPRFYDQIIRVVEDLDQRPPMVMIQVLIGEVTLGNTREFGVELGLQDSLVFDRGLGTNFIGFPFNQQQTGNNNNTGSLGTRDNVAGQALSNLNVGRVNANLGYGGMVLSAGNESVNVLIRALQDRNQMRILSRPQIMTLDNQVAFVQIGARVPRIVNSTINQLGNTQNTVQDVNVGILLRVQPRISPDGLVVMLLDTEKSSVGSIAAGIPIAVSPTGTPINSPQINTTTAQTTLSARSGQTVVFSGLITDTKSTVTRGIPYISDIPLLGSLFRFDSESAMRTELLIIMTPYIIKDDEDYEWIKRTESDRMSWCLADVVNVHGDVGLSGGNGYSTKKPTSVIYPDMDPTGLEGLPTPAEKPAELPLMLPYQSNNLPAHESVPRASFATPPSAQKPNQLPSVQERQAATAGYQDPNTRVYYGEPAAYSVPRNTNGPSR